MSADDMFNTGLNNFKSGNYLQGIVQTAGAPLLGAAFMAIPDAADAPIKGGVKAARAASSARTVDKAVDLSKISTTDAKKMYDNLMQQQSVLLQQLREAESIPGVRGNSTLQQKIYSNSNGAWAGNTWVTPSVDYSDRENAIQAIKDQINAVNQQIRNLSDAGHNFTGYSDDVTETSLKPRQYYAQASDGTVGYATQRTPRTRKPTKSTTDIVKEEALPVESPRPTMSEVEIMARDKVNSVQVLADNRKYSRADRKTGNQTPKHMPHSSVRQDNLRAGLDAYGNPRGTVYHNLEDYNLGYAWDYRKGFLGNFNQLKKWIAEKHPDIKYYHDASVWKYLLKNFPEQMKLSGYLLIHRQGGLLNYSTYFS